MTIMVDRALKINYLSLNISYNKLNNNSNEYLFVSLLNECKALTFNRKVR